VLWYRATLPATAETPRQERDVALFAVWNRSVGLYLESLGLGTRPGEGLRFLVQGRELRVLTPGSGFAYSREKHVVYSEKEGGGELVSIETAIGRLEALRLDLREGAAKTRYWFVPGRGLMRMEVEVDDERVLALEFLKEVPRGRPREGYRTDRPDRMWASLNRALIRLDVDSLESFLAPSLRARLRRPAWSVIEKLGGPPAPADVDLVAERIRWMVPDLLDVRLQPTGKWIVDEKSRPPRASAEALLTARLDGGVRRTKAKIILERRNGAWQWSDFVKVD
jgi:hypothetical protein